jgi:hypothetical protein
MRQAFATLLALVIGGLVSSVASPALACGCGAYIPNRSGASVVDERALIAWNGTTEDILMSFDVAGRVGNARAVGGPGITWRRPGVRSAQPAHVSAR